MIKVTTAREGIAILAAQLKTFVTGPRMAQDGLADDGLRANLETGRKGSLPDQLKFMNVLRDVARYLGYGVREHRIGAKSIGGKAIAFVFGVLGPAAIEEMKAAGGQDTVAKVDQGSRIS